MCGRLEVICNYRPRSVVDVLPRHRDRKRQPGVLRQPDDHLPCCEGLEHLVAVVEWGSDREHAPAVGLISGRARHRTRWDGNGHVDAQRLAAMALHLGSGEAQKRQVVLLGRQRQP